MHHHVLELWGLQFSDAAFSNFVLGKMGLVVFGFYGYKSRTVKVYLWSAVQIFRQLKDFAACLRNRKTKTSNAWDECSCKTWEDGMWSAPKWEFRFAPQLRVLSSLAWKRSLPAFSKVFPKSRPFPAATTIEDPDYCVEHKIAWNPHLDSNIVQMRNANFGPKTEHFVYFSQQQT